MHFLPVNDGQMYRAGCKNWPALRRFCQTTGPSTCSTTSPDPDARHVRADFAADHDRVVSWHRGPVRSRTILDPPNRRASFAATTCARESSSGPGIRAYDPNARPPDPPIHQQLAQFLGAAAYDPKLEIVYLPMGVSDTRYLGRQSHRVARALLQCVLALDIISGKLAWFYQSTHHDLWDMDQPAQPTIADIAGKDGKIVPVVYAPAKTGNLYVLDRRTGTPVVPAPERPVPRGPRQAITLRRRSRFPISRSGRARTFPARTCGVRRCMTSSFAASCSIGCVTTASTRRPRCKARWCSRGTSACSSGEDRRRHRSPDRHRQPDRVAVRLATDSARPGQSDGADSRCEGQRHRSGRAAAIWRAFWRTLNPFLSPFGLPCKQPAWGYMAAIDLEDKPNHLEKAHRYHA